MREALLYEKAEGGIAVCNLCAHRCRVRSGKAGACAVRVNREGVLYTLVDDRVIALDVDPVEKKPLFHFLPGSRAFSFAAPGCNFRCDFCQNWTISQMPHGRSVWLPGPHASPAALVEQALASASASIAYTYTEPTIFFELASETAALARAAGLKNIFVTNGYMTPEALDLALVWLDAANVDLKGFDDRRHRRVVGGRLQPVLDTIRAMKRGGIWLEVTTLVVPGFNDSDEELRAIARFLVSVDPDVPWHLSAFFPAHRMLETPPTEVAALERARTIGFQEGLRFVYCGNIPGQGHESTLCPSCREVLVERWGFEVRRVRIKDGACPTCGESIAGVWGPRASDNTRTLVGAA